MTDVLTLEPVKPNLFTLDRPGWIPEHITHDWDPDPYAYQTEEELIPAGGLHGQLLGRMMEVLPYDLKTKDLMLLMDCFMLYRNALGIKNRIAPDLWLMPFRKPVPSAYDLDVEPPPLCVVEITSPSSHAKDLDGNVNFYLGLDIPSYLIIDAITPQGAERAQIRLYLWRQHPDGPKRMKPDAEGFLLLPEMGLKIKAIGQDILLVDVVTGQVLLNIEKFTMTLQAEREARQAEREETEAKLAAEREETEAKLAAERAEREESEAKLAAEREARQAEREGGEAKLAAERQQIALKMKQEGLSLDLISKIIGLTRDELEILFKR